MTSDVPQGRSSKTVGLVALCAILWGLYWVPIHVLSNRGLSGPMVSLLLTLAATLIALPIWLRSKPRLPEWRSLLGAIGIGAAFSLYGIAITYSDVVRVVLLFYIAPAWSTIIECLFFGRRWSWRSLFGIALSLLGIIVIFRGELPLDGLGALGDWMALFAGLSWSIGSALMFSAKRIDLKVMMLSSFSIAVVISAACLLFLSNESRLLPTNQIGPLAVTFGLCALFAMIYVYPVTYITLWGATLISPATMSFLLTLEVIAAVVSSAIFLNLGFGLIELVGTCLIISAALVEVLRPRQA